MIWVIGGTKDSRDFLEKFIKYDKERDSHVGIGLRYHFCCWCSPLVKLDVLCPLCDYKAPAQNCISDSLHSFFHL